MPLRVIIADDNKLMRRNIRSMQSLLRSDVDSAVKQPLDQLADTVDPAILMRVGMGLVKLLRSALRKYGRLDR